MKAWIHKFDSINTNFDSEEAEDILRIVEASLGSMDKSSRPLLQRKVEPQGFYWSC